MLKKLFFIKTLSLAFVLLFNLFLAVGVNAGAGGANELLWDNQAENIQANTGLGNDDPRYIAANIINIVLGFLGIISLALILFAGFKWMTAAGNDSKIDEAKKLLTAAVIGLIIILAAFALSSFVLDAVYRATTDNS